MFYEVSYSSGSGGGSSSGGGGSGGGGSGGGSGSGHEGLDAEYMVVLCQEGGNSPSDDACVPSPGPALDCSFAAGLARLGTLTSLLETRIEALRIAP